MGAAFGLCTEAPVDYRLSWLWNELLITSPEGAWLKVGGWEEGGRRAPSAFWPNPTCLVRAQGDAGERLILTKQGG